MKKHSFLIIALMLLTSTLAAQNNKASVSLTAAIYEEEVSGNLDKAVELYLNILKKYPDDRQMAAKTLYHLGLVNEKMGKQKANEYFTRLVNSYPDQIEVVTLAKARLAANGNHGNNGDANGATGSTGIAMRRIWAAGKDGPLSFTPDGRYVVFYSSEDNNLWLRDLLSGERKQITNDASTVNWTFPSGFVTISPDGRQIAYGWWIKSYGELRLSNLDGSSMRVLHNGQVGKSLYPQAWMPDGRQILAISINIKSKDNLYQRHIISLPDGVIHDIGMPSKEYFDWAYPSPDGKYIAYGQKDDIFIYNIASKQDTALVQNPAVDNMVGWLNDGTGILFMSKRSGNPDLYKLKIRNGLPLGDPEFLRGNLISESYFFLTRDGKLFQTENTGTASSFTVNMDKQTGMLTGTPSLVDKNYPGTRRPAWSSDGKLLYYELYKGSDNAQSHVLEIRSEVTDQTREITLKTKLLGWYRPILSPDGHRFAITGTDENHNFGIFAIDSESGDVTQLAKIPTENVAVDPCQNWSPDGKAIYYKVRSLEKSEEFIIRRKDLTTGEEKDIHHGSNTRDMKISSDGTRFVYFRMDTLTKSFVLGILDIQTDKELELWRVSEVETPGVSGPTWAPDGKHVLVCKELKKGSELWQFPVGGGPGEKLYSSPESSWGFVMHPSGKCIAFTQDQPNCEVWVLENFLPK